MITHDPAQANNDVGVRAVAKILPGPPLPDDTQRHFNFSSRGDPTFQPYSPENEIVVEVNAVGKRILLCINEAETRVSWAHLSALQNPQSHTVIPLV